MRRWKRSVPIAVLLLALLAALSWRLWTPGIARSLVCSESVARTDAMLVENFEPTYVLFEKAAELEKAGMAPMAFVPVEEAPNRAGPNPVSRGVAEVMARHARLRSWRVVTIRQTEPIVFNAGSQLASHLAQEGIRSVTVLTSAFRSRRSYLVYRKTLGDAGIAVHCVPVFGRTTPEDWTQTWHGIQEVLEQQGKLQYYRWWVLPFGAR